MDCLGSIDSSRLVHRLDAEVKKLIGELGNFGVDTLITNLLIDQLVGSQAQC